MWKKWSFVKKHKKIVFIFFQRESAKGSSLPTHLTQNLGVAIYFYSQYIFSTFTSVADDSKIALYHTPLSATPFTVYEAHVTVTDMTLR